MTVVERIVSDFSSKTVLAEAGIRDKNAPPKDGKTWFR